MAHTLTTQQLSALLETHFGITADALHLLESHFGTDIYRADAGESAYLVKLFPPELTGARHEGDVTTFLRGKGIRVARHRAAADGLYCAAVGEQLMTVRDFVHGDTFPVNSAPDWVLCRMATYLAELHIALRDYPALPTAFSADFFSPLHAQKKRSRYRERAPQTRGAVRERYEAQIRHLERVSLFSIDTTRLTYRASHGDYHIGQVVAANGDITVIDFAAAARLPVVLELATSFLFASPRCKDGEIPADALRRYVAAYQERAPLSAYDRAALPYVCYFWHTLCNYAPEEIVPENYAATARLIAAAQDWFFDNVEQLSAAVGT